MAVDRAGLRVLSRDESLHLLATTNFGRIAISSRALPMILPVQFELDGDRIVVTTWDGSILSKATRGAVVAFEAEGPARLGHPSWSVLVNGVADHVGEVACAERGSAWVPDRSACVISISTDHVSGRQTPDHWQDVQPWSACVAGRTLDV